MIVRCHPRLRAALATATVLVTLSLAARGQHALPYGLAVSDAELGFMVGQFSLGVDRELGRNGHPIDPIGAALAYRRAAVLGFPLAQHRLGRLYESGRGVARDEIHALMWYTLAARGGHGIAAADRDALEEKLSFEEAGLAAVLAKELGRHLPGSPR